MRIFRNDRIAVGIVRLQLQCVELVLTGQRRAGIFFAADHLLLKILIGLIPMLDRHADAAHHHERATRKPIGRCLI